MPKKLADWFRMKRVEWLEDRARQCRINAAESREFADECEQQADYYQSRADRLKNEPHQYRNHEF